MINENVSRRIYLTIPDGVADQLDRWAKAENNKTASLAALIVESAVRTAADEGKIPPIDIESGDRSAKQFLSDIALGKPPSDSSLIEVAHHLGVPAERLMRIRSKLFD